MLYPYMTLADETIVTHSHLIDDNGVKKVFVNFERPTDDGFDTARCELPSYHWVMREGYSDKEIAEFEQLMRANAHLFFKYAQSGGIRIA